MAVAYEKRDIDLGRLVRIGFVITALVAMSFVLMWWLFGFLVEHEAETSGRPHPHARELGRSAPQAPVLQTNPRDDLLALRATEQLVLDTYAWIDKERGVVRIPIEKAMDLTARRGLLARPKSAGDSP
jgi:hypothetical protein